jgi:hypothetical protein
MKSRTKAVERDLCGAMEHLLMHRSRTSHRCKCGHRTVFGYIEAGECPECNGAIAFEGDEDMNPERLEQIQAEIENKEFERDLRIKLALLQAAVTLRTFLERREAVTEAKAMWGILNDER